MPPSVPAALRQTPRRAQGPLAILARDPLRSDRRGSRRRRAARAPRSWVMASAAAIQSRKLRRTGFAATMPTPDDGVTSDRTLSGASSKRALEKSLGRRRARNRRGSHRRRATRRRPTRKVLREHAREQVEPRPQVEPSRGGARSAHRRLLVRRADCAAKPRGQSRDIGRRRRSRCTRRSPCPSSHCRASVVFPYPAGATSILIRPWLSSSRRCQPRPLDDPAAPDLRLSCSALAHVSSAGAANPPLSVPCFGSRLNRRSRDPTGSRERCRQPLDPEDRGLAREGRRPSGSDRRSGAGAGDGRRASGGARRNAP